MSQTAAHQQLSTGVNVGFDVELRKVFKVYHGEPAVRSVDLSIQRGEFFSILGPSGCGKTTTLRLIAGFETPTAGEIVIGGQLINHVPPYRRPVNTVFQSYALFGHLSVWENVAFGLRIQKCSRSEIQTRVQEALKLVKMEGFAKRSPASLSGGQQQRVALARALVNRPTVVLLDEPLGALDLKLRKEMQVELSLLHRELGVTFVMVTHDQEEALCLSDRIAVMNAGQVEQIGTPDQIYERPQTAFVASFIGDTNLFRGRIEGAHPSMLWIRTESGLKMKVQPAHTREPLTSGRVVVSVRPENIQVSLTPHEPGNSFEGRLQDVMYLGTHVHYFVVLSSGDRITVRQTNGAAVPSAETPIYLFWGAEAGLALPEQG
ncbi:ABC transporter ATP-binding protein [Myxacorys almedinensis]|uniref:Spermidine/putrescine import ATP-binding protein PotA n=1 Tax=Myxacorys almedinensis A TaxID=2690445 RepID=A0A8J7Z5Z2_9CYAN|nr:ABC transporter ATP-binding protein [Myxacorys almedinensis]NDJ18506.1 polyamine ABC transporter ATP-binding protein [Myxacorys almedinensis A]